MPTLLNTKPSPAGAFVWLGTTAIIFALSACERFDSGPQSKTPAALADAETADRVSRMGLTRGQIQFLQMKVATHHVREAMAIFRKVQQSQGLVLTAGGSADLASLEESLKRVEHLLIEEAGLVQYSNQTRPISAPSLAPGEVAKLLDQVMALESSIAWPVSSPEQKAVAQALVNAMDAHETTEAPLRR